MITLKLRGDVQADIAWDTEPPRAGEFVHYGQRWYKVKDVAWAIVELPEGGIGYDLGLVLAGSHAPHGLKPNPAAVVVAEGVPA